MLEKFTSSKFKWQGIPDIYDSFSEKYGPNSTVTVLFIGLVTGWMARLSEPEWPGKYRDGTLRQWRSPILVLTGFGVAKLR